MRKTLLTVMIAAGSMVVGCQSTEVDTGGAIQELQVNTFRTQWTRQLQMSGRPREVHIRGESLFVYSTNNMLFRLDRNSGDVVFMSDVAPAGAKVGAPALVGDQLAVPSDTSIFMLDARGFRDRVIQLDSPIRSGIVADENGIYCGIDAGRSGGRVAAIDYDRSYSPFRWQLMTRGTVIATPAVHGGNIFAASDDGHVYAIDPDRGSLWSGIGGTFKTDGPVHGDVKADSTGVYVASADSKLYCLDLNSGRIRWQYHAGAPLYDTPAVTRTSVYIQVRNQGVSALDKNDGDYNRQPRWNVREATEFIAEDAQHAFLRGRDNSILAVDRNSGEIRFKSERRDLVAFAVNEQDGTIYAVTRGGRVFAAVPVTRPGEVGELVMLDLPRGATSH